MEGPLLHEPLQACARLNIGRSKIFELIGSGEIESVKVGRKRLIPEEALLDYVAHLREVARLRGKQIEQQAA